MTTLELTSWNVEEDAELALSLWGDAGVMKWVEGRLEDLDAARGCLKVAVKVEEDLGFCLWKLLVDGEFAGASGVHDDGELAVHLLPAFQGRGLGTRAALAALRRSGGRTVPWCRICWRDPRRSSS